VYVPRLLDAYIAELLAGLPAVLIVGPRAAGKTTTARRLARSTIRLDRPAEAAVVRADPDVAIAGYEEPLLIDEWQMVPEVLGAVKRSIDDDPRPGRFLLTGSVRAELSAAGWPATGRVVRVPLFGLSQRELVGATAERSLVDRLFGSDVDTFPMPAEVPDLRDYVELALRGGFPDVALQPSWRLRVRWLRGYLDQVVERDAASSGGDRDPRRLRRYLEAIGANTAGAPDHKTLYDAADISRATALAYDVLLEALFVTEQVPAWSTNRLARLIRAPKRYLVEPALLGVLTGVDSRGALRDVDVLGRLLDTYVVAQLRAEMDVCDPPVTMFHLRLEHGRREADLLLEAPDGRIVAIEVKAAAAPTRDMARHLIWLRDQLGDIMVRGLLFHTGPRPFSLDERILALPIWALWAGAPR
jgi:predicted AAA+ superfamily ATPase